jgi:HAD superfamily hydrolase (TIGR01490 family)
MKRTGAFFDLDQTILTTNTSVKWGMLMFFKGDLPWKFFYLAALYGPLYKLKILPFELAMGKLISTLKGRSARRTLKITREYFEKRKILLYRPRLLQQIGWHKAKKHKIVIVTQTLDFIARIFAKDLGVKHFISTEVEIKNGKFTGNVKPCVSYKKDDLMENIAKKLNISLRKSYAYTDSIKDVEMLEKVGHRYVVNPGMMLKKMAQHKGWNIWEI